MNAMKMSPSRMSGKLIALSLAILLGMAAVAQETDPKANYVIQGLSLIHISEPTRPY